MAIIPITFLAGYYLTTIPSYIAALDESPASSPLQVGVAVWCGDGGGRDSRVNMSSQLSYHAMLCKQYVDCTLQWGINQTVAAERDVQGVQLQSSGCAKHLFCTHCVNRRLLIKCYAYWLTITKGALEPLFISA